MIIRLSGVSSYSMDASKLFSEHTQTLSRELQQHLQEIAAIGSGVLIHSGRQHYYFADDQAPPFRAWGHFVRWVPVDRPDQFVLLLPGRRPVFFAVIANDFWHDQHMDMPAWWADAMDIVVISDPAQLARQLIPLTGAESLLYLGEDEDLARSLGITPEHINPAALLHALDYQRAYKTAYEVHRLAEANELAQTGHQAAHEAFLAGADELGIHQAYLTACRVQDQDLPYPSIVALDKHAAILHYQHKSRLKPPLQPGRSQILLIDAGCRTYGYCSDITRTWLAPQGSLLFAELLAGMQKLQKALIQSIAEGQSFIDLHEQTHHRIGELLIDVGVCRGESEQLVSTGVTAAFFPHGLGHLLGLQVHDSGGRLTSPAGDIVQPPAAYPALRLTRPVQNHMVFTIEPGVYFIPMLLDPLRGTETGRQINWDAIDELIPLGGIRIEDNIWVHDGLVHNLSLRPLVD